MRRLLATFVFLQAVSIQAPVNGQTGTQAKALYTKLFVTDSYNSRIRPATNQSEPTVVTINLLLVAINEVNTVQQTLKTTAFLEIQWTDDFLQWTPLSYGDLIEYHWPQNDVWKPDIALSNSYSSFDSLGSSSLIVLNSHNGTVTWMPYEVFTSTCSMDVSKFPFDTQTCKINFVSWGYRKSEVTLTGGDVGFGLDDFEQHQDWSIVSTTWSVDTDPDDDIIMFELKIKRNPTYVIVTVILPLIILAILNLFVFAVPCDCGERISYAITVFLTFAVLFSLVAASLPETVANMVMFLILMTISSALTCVISIIHVRCYNFDATDRRIPTFLVVLSNFAMCKLNYARKEPGKGNKINNSAKLDRCKGSHMGDSASDVETETVNHNAGKTETRVTSWKDVVDGMDVFFFYIFAVYLVLSSVIILSMTI